MLSMHICALEYILSEDENYEKKDIIYYNFYTITGSYF